MANILNNMNLNILIEFFTFPLQRFLSGVITGDNVLNKFEFVNSLIFDARKEYESDSSKPLYISIEVGEEFTEYNQNKDIEQILMDKIISSFPLSITGNNTNLEFKFCIEKHNNPVLIVFNNFDFINKEYKPGISKIINTIFKTTENGGQIKINLLFLVKTSDRIFELFDKETAVKVSSIKLPIYNFDFKG